MDKKELILLCNDMLHEIESEVKKQNLVEALPVLENFFKQLQSLEKDIDVFGDEQELILENIVKSLSNIDSERIKNFKEVLQMLNTVEDQIGELKNYLILGKSEQIMDILGKIRKELNAVSVKI